MNNHQIIEVTDAAVNYLKTVVQQENALGFRLSIKKAGCNGYMYVPDVVKQINEADTCISLDGLAIYIDHKAIDKVTGTVIDCVKKELGQKQIVFKNPRAKGECGCGESFNLD